MIDRHLILVLCALFMTCAAFSGHTLADDRPNIVLIISDDQAWTDYGFMGHESIETPNLDRLAAQSRLFRRGYVPTSLCCPSLASIISGRYPHEHYITGNEPPLPPGGKHSDPDYQKEDRAMDDYIEKIPTLPRILGEHGYLSLQTGKWWYGSFERGGFTHGMTHGDVKRGGRHGDVGLTIGRDTMKPIEDFVDLAKDENKPFMIWYAPFLPHTPHNPPNELLKKYTDKVDSVHIARYWAMCEWFDQTCGQLVDILEDRGVRDNTIIIYVCDNGWINLPNRQAYAKRSKRSPYEGGIRTPIFVNWPGHIEPMDDPNLATSIDILPTVLCACGIDFKDEEHGDLPGVDLLDDEALTRRDTIYGEIFLHNANDIHDPTANLRYRWIISDKWKMILPYKPNEKGVTTKLYEILEDPYEQNELLSEHRDAAQDLKEKLDRWWAPEK